MRQSERAAPPRVVQQKKSAGVDGIGAGTGKIIMALLTPDKFLARRCRSCVGWPVRAILGGLPAVERNGTADAVAAALFRVVERRVGRFQQIVGGGDRRVARC